MVDFKRLSTRAKDLVEKRGGSDSLKQDAEELKSIAKGPGSFADKAKAAAAALKDPGARAQGPGGETPAGTPAAAAPPADAARAEAKVEGEHRGKHADGNATDARGEERRDPGTDGGEAEGRDRPGGAGGAV